MSTAEATQGREVDAVVAAATAGDESAFASIVERYERELQVHCYRMLGSLQDSEDLVQETFLRAWRKRTSFQGRSTFRAWLYRIATNACLDALAQHRKRAPVQHAPTTGEAGPPPSDLAWLQPYPDNLLEGIASSDAEPDAAVVSKETIELAFLVAIQHLPPRQRAVLILRDVLDWSAKETAALLDVSVQSANSALQRARTTLKKHLPERRLEWGPGSAPSEDERALLERYVEATEHADTAAFVEMMREDARFSMPPEPEFFVGNQAIVDAWVAGGFGSEAFGEMRCLTTRANMQPAVAVYVRKPGESEFRPLAIDVLKIEDGVVAEIVTFMPDLFPAFGLPPRL